MVSSALAAINCIRLLRVYNSLALVSLVCVLSLLDDNPAGEEPVNYDEEMSDRRERAPEKDPRDVSPATHTRYSHSYSCEQCNTPGMLERSCLAELTVVCLPCRWR